MGGSYLPCDSWTLTLRRRVKRCSAGNWITGSELRRLRRVGLSEASPGQLKESSLLPWVRETHTLALPQPRSMLLHVWRPGLVSPRLVVSLMTQKTAAVPPLPVYPISLPSPRVSRRLIPELHDWGTEPFYVAHILRRQSQI